MNDLFYAAGALLVFAIWILAAVFLRTGKKKGRPEKDPEKRRTNAMRDLEKIRRRVQDKHGPLIDPDNPPPEVMRRQIEKDVDNDASRAAATLKKMLDR